MPDPENVPFEFNGKPVGSEPPASDHVYGGVPPVNVNCPGYGRNAAIGNTPGVGTPSG